MIGLRIPALLVTAARLGAGIMSSPSYDAELAGKSSWPAPAGALSIMSYNVNGLPCRSPLAVRKQFPLLVSA